MSGYELIRQNTSELVLMAGMIPEGSEYNVYLDAAAAKEVLDGWPTKVTICDFSVGARVTNGKIFKGDFGNPVAAAYAFNGGSESYDLLTMHYAITRDEKIWAVHGPGKLEVRGSTTHWVDGEQGNHYYIKLKCDSTVIENRLEGILARLKTGGNG